MSEYSIDVDWSGEHEDWNMIGRDLMSELAREEGTPQNKEFLEQYGYLTEDDEDPYDYIDEWADNHTPMMNYAYPLEITPSDEKIIEVCERTACTVVEKESTGEYFLALCGGGMDLSQDIALAYNIAQKWLPTSLLQSVCSQYGLSKSGKEFKQIKEIIIEQSVMEGNRLLELAKRWEEIEIPSEA